MKTSTPVDKQKLTKAINLAEEKGPLSNRNELFFAVAEHYNKMDPPKPIKAGVVRSRVISWGLRIVTPKGKRGNSNIGGTKNRQPRAEKFKNNPKIQKSISEIRKIVPERFIPVVDKLEGGSITAAIKTKCLDCSDYQTSEIKHCPCINCGLWPVRPYQ